VILYNVGEWTFLLAPALTSLSHRLLLSRFVLSANLHGGTVVASYPFDDSFTHKQQGAYSPSADDALFRYLARVYAQNHPVMSTGQPNCPGQQETFEDGITNGAKWYDVQGKMLTAHPLVSLCCIQARVLFLPGESVIVVLSSHHHCNTPALTAGFHSDYTQ